MCVLPRFDLEVYGLILQLDFYRTESDVFASGIIQKMASRNL